MVHALDELRRILMPGGTLLDLRPLADSWPVEIVESDNHHQTGHLTDLPTGLGDDQAANLAVEEAARCGWFKRGSNLTFPLYAYWDDPDEMIAYVTDRWTDFVRLDDDVQKTTQAAWAAAGADKRLRLKLNMLLTSWQKQ